MRRIDHAGISFEVPDEATEDRAVVYLDPEGASVVSVMSRPADAPMAVLRAKLRRDARALEDFALVRSRDLAVAGRPAAEAEIAFRGAAGPTTERIVAVAHAHATYVLDFCFVGPVAEHVRAQTLFAFLARSIGS